MEERIKERTPRFKSHRAPLNRSAAILAAEAAMQTKRPATTCVQPFPSFCDQDGRAPKARFRGRRDDLVAIAPLLDPLTLSSRGEEETDVRLRDILTRFRMAESEFEIFDD